MKTDWFWIVLVCIGYVLLIVRLARANDRFQAQLASMTEEELHEESWWEGQDGHYPNPFSAELERRERERDQAARGTA